MASDLKALFRDLGRGVTGALILGTPFLFTMETWWLGWRLPAYPILGFALVGLIVILAASWAAGFREEERQNGPTSVGQWLREVAEIVLESFVAAYIVLGLFGIIEWREAPLTLARLGLLQVVALGLGAALANRILKGRGEAGGQQSPFPKDVAVFAMGALFFALPISPTEEMELIAAHAGWWRLAGAIVVSLLLTHMVLYELEFRGQAGRIGGQGIFLRIGETFMVYVVALLVSAFLLWGLGHFQGSPPEVWVQTTIVLGFPATLGGAAAQVVV